MTRWPALHSIVWDIEENAAIVVRPDRFERPAFWFVARRSIQLSYGRTTQRPFYRTRSDLPKSTAGRVRAGGKAKTREGKLAIVWSAESRDEKEVSRTRSLVRLRTRPPSRVRPRATPASILRVRRTRPARSHPPPFDRSQKDCGCRRWRRL